MSPWYQDMPNGAAGTWITKKSKSVLAGNPLTVTVMVSVAPLETMCTVALAFGTHVAGRPAVRTMPNVVLVVALWATDPATPESASAPIVTNRRAFHLHCGSCVIRSHSPSTGTARPSAARRVAARGAGPAYGPEGLENGSGLAIGRRWEGRDGESVPSRRG